MKTCKYKLRILTETGWRFEPCEEPTIHIVNRSRQPVKKKVVEIDGVRERRCFYSVEAGDYCYYHQKVIDELIPEKGEYNERANQHSSSPRS